MTNEPFTVIIPARLASTRLPEKVLLDIAGKPMVRHVYERACESGAERVIVAVDDERVAGALGDAETCRTSPAHRSGTERIAEVVERLAIAPDAVLVNVQADEPLLPPVLIRQVASNLAARPAADVATLCEPMASVDEVFDPNAVKVVRDRSGFALYFSRAPIAWQRDAFPGRDGWRAGGHFRHLGLYAYRARVRADVRGSPARRPRGHGVARTAPGARPRREDPRGRGGGDAGSGGRYRGRPGGPGVGAAGGGALGPRRRASVTEYVVDASVAVEYLLRTPLGVAVADLLDSASLTAPELMDAEVVSVLRAECCSAGSTTHGQPWPWRTWRTGRWTASPTGSSPGWPGVTGITWGPTTRST